VIVEWVLWRDVVGGRGCFGFVGGEEADMGGKCGVEGVFLEFGEGTKPYRGGLTRKTLSKECRARGQMPSQAEKTGRARTSKKRFRWEFGGKGKNIVLQHFKGKG